MSFKFMPRDFAWDFSYHPDSPAGTLQRVCDQANTLLDKHVKTLPEVFSNTTEIHGQESWDMCHEPYDTHSARLWSIQEIKLASHECDHTIQPTVIFGDINAATKHFCFKCGKEFKPTQWEAVE